ncbi:hypothetical protein NDU88_001066 [Pleurodeles waltl]|uniref:Uncharacterized protein n=1 Tax=Pleurodeles waltl TaxID=8319 RepID=A0AAV7U672_PLEWA|nr:hypothetical protein NDU88_001066 [Pleurodeles waltl]
MGSERSRSPLFPDGSQSSSGCFSLDGYARGGWLSPRAWACLFRMAPTSEPVGGSLSLLAAPHHNGAASRGINCESLVLVGRAAPPPLALTAAPLLLTCSTTSSLPPGEARGPTITVGPLRGAGVPSSRPQVFRPPPSDTSAQWSRHSGAAAILVLGGRRENTPISPQSLIGFYQRRLHFSQAVP